MIESGFFLGLVQFVSILNMKRIKFKEPFLNVLTFYN